MELSILHPMIVHFPIALILVAFLAEFVNLVCKKCDYAKCSFWLTIFSALSAIAAVSTGAFISAQKVTAGPALAVMNVHSSYAAATTTIIIIAAIFKIVTMRRCSTCKTVKYLSFALMLAAAICVSLTGFKGGEIVYGIWLKFV